MKRIILVLLLACLSLSSYATKKPEWVKKRPTDKLAYIGIGFASKEVADYMQVAKQQALKDLSSEIKVEVQSESLLQTMERDNQVSSFVSSNIQVSTQEELEEFQLTDSWEDKKQYWVYYRLSKLDYMETVASRKAKVVNEAYAYWTKGLEAELTGDLTTAIEMYTKGLTAVEPKANEELKTSHNGKSIDVAIELYNSLNSIFNDITVEANVDELQMQAFQASNESVTFSVFRRNVALKNIKLNIAFISGSGQLSQNRTTDQNGNLQLFIQNITSKDRHHEIQATLDVGQFSIYSSEFLHKLLSSFKTNPPSTTVGITVTPVETKVYVKNTGRSHESLSKSIRSLLTNNYFTVVYDETDANLIVILKSTIKKGKGKVKGDMYDFNEYFTTVEIEVIDVESSQSLVNYVVNEHRSLAPESRSESQAENTAIKEVMKKIDKDFKKELNNLNINN